MLIDKHIENCCSLHQVSPNMSVVSLCLMKPLEIKQNLVESNSLKFLEIKVSTVVLKLTQASSTLGEQMMKLSLKALMGLANAVQSIISSDADLPSGEQCSRLVKDFHQKLQLWRMLSNQQDMDQFVKQMVQFQLQNQRFFRMVITVLKFAQLSPNKCSPL